MLKFLPEIRNYEKITDFKKNQITSRNEKSNN